MSDLPEAAAPAPATPSRVRGAAVLGARIATGTVAVVIAAVAVSAAGLLPLPTIGSVPSSVIVTPAPSAPELVCPGAVLQLGDDLGNDATKLNAVGEPQLAFASTIGTPTVTALDFADASSSADGAPFLLTGTAADSATGLAGAQYQAVDHGDIRGLAAAACTRPSSDSWLLGGATTVGRTTLLLLANPGVLASTVTIELYSEDGLVEAPGTTGITVPANSQRAFSLAGFANSLEAIAVHVTSRGGPIAATLQESIVRGIEPGGVDLVGATMAPSTINVIPGVVVFGTEATQARLGEAGFEDLGSVLRLFVPGDETVQATVNLVPESTDGTGVSFDLTLGSGAVTDVPIEELADGGYTVIVSSSAPVAAAMRVSTVAADDTRIAGDTDGAWLAAAPQLAGDVFVTAARGAGGALHVSNPGEGDATLTLVPLSGSSISVVVPAGSSIAVAVAAGESYRLEGITGLYASMAYVSPGAIAGYVVGTAAEIAAPVTVYPQ